MSSSLVVSVVHAVARSLGEPVELPVLADERLAGPELADEITAAASYHAILPLLWDAVQRPGVPAALRGAVHDAYLPLVARGLRLRHLLQVVDRALSSADVPYAVYKGPAVARHYRSPDQRAFGDIDLLVEHRDLDRVGTALHDAGLRGGWTGVPEGYGESVYVLGGHGALDLHWHVMREPRVRAAFALDTAAMLERACRVPVGELEVCVLDEVDEFIAVATHACFDGAYRLGWFVDMARLLRSPTFDADALARRCAGAGTALPVQVILDRTERALGVAGPTLARGAWRAVLDRLSAARPAERSFRQAGRGGLIFRATRATSTASFAALAAIAVREGALPLLTDRNHRWRVVRNRRF